jgi:hypothetical protein
MLQRGLTKLELRPEDKEEVRCFTRCDGEVDPERICERHRPLNDEIILPPHCLLQYDRIQEERQTQKQSDPWPQTVKSTKPTAAQRIGLVPPPASQR